jgi:heme-degrading monooxygenase HmoA
MERNQTSERIIIDRFIVPQKSKPEFIERMDINRNFIKTLPGFIEDKVYERIDEQGNLICATVAVWSSEEAIRNAKEAVQAEYKKEGFNLPAMLERLNITMAERGIYTGQMK